MAERWSLAASFAAAAVLLSAGMAVVLLVPRFALASDEVDFAPDIRWPDPSMAAPRNPEEGPIMVTVEYRIDPARADEFLSAMEDVRAMRRRDGALQWGIFRDLAEPRRFVETFLVESWAEHLRQHERTTRANRRIHARALAFHEPAEPPAVSHMIWGAARVDLASPARSPE